MNTQKEEQQNKIESDNFWKDIIYNKDGSLNEEQILKELSDFRYIMKQVPIVYEEVAGLTKLMYPAKTIIQEFESRNLDKEITKSDIRDMIDQCSDIEELKDELRYYFELDPEY